MADATIFQIENGTIAFSVVDKTEPGYSDAWRAPGGLGVMAVDMDDYESDSASWKCQATSGALTASQSTATVDVPATFCGPARSIPQPAETSYSLDLSFLQDPNVAAGLSAFLFEHDTEEAYVLFGLDGLNPPKLIGRVRLVSGTIGGPARSNLTADVSLPLTGKPQIAFGTSTTSAVIPSTVVATGATAGTPGTFTPEGAVPAANLAGLATVIASPLTAWTTGQRVVLGDNTAAYWDGDSWNAGSAP